MESRFAARKCATWAIRSHLLSHRAACVRQCRSCARGTFSGSGAVEGSTTKTTRRANNFVACNDSGVEAAVSAAHIRLDQPRRILLDRATRPRVEPIRREQDFRAHIPIFAHSSRRFARRDRKSGLPQWALIGRSEGDRDRPFQSIHPSVETKNAGTANKQVDVIRHDYIPSNSDPKINAGHTDVTLKCAMRVFHASPMQCTDRHKEQRWVVGLKNLLKPRRTILNHREPTIAADTAASTPTSKSRSAQRIRDFSLE